MLNCLSCKFAVWERTLAGQLHPSGEGKCTWRMPGILLPKAFYYIGKESPKPMGGHINRNEQTKECDAWSHITINISMRGNQINIKEIITEYLKSINADGLACADVECGCGIDDLMSCDAPSDCIPAKKFNCDSCDYEDRDGCPYDSASGPCYFAIKETK